MTTAWRKVATAAVIEIDWNWKTSSWEVKERQTKEGKIQLCKSISSRLWSRPEERSQVNAIGNDGDATKESHHIISCLRRRLRPQLKKREILLICILDWRNGQCFNETKESSSCATDSWLMKPWRGGRKKILLNPVAAITWRVASITQILTRRIMMQTSRHQSREIRLGSLLVE